MDLTFTNKIASNIHHFCLKQMVEEGKYTEDPTKFRQNI